MTMRRLILAGLAVVTAATLAVAGGISSLPVGSPAFDQAFGTTVGGMLCRAAAGWGLVAPGTAGQVLTVPAGGGCPTWSAASSSSASQSANTVLAGPASGAAAAPGYRALVPADLPPVPDGCIRMSVQSTTVLAFSPYGCNTVAINGVPRTIAATTFTPTTPVASTLYYAYVAWTGTAIQYSISTAGHITGADGREYRNDSGSANSSFLFVGLLYTNASTQFVDNVSWRGCLNWFNRRTLKAEIAANNQINSATTTNAQAFGNTATFLSWGAEATMLTDSGAGQPSASGAVVTAYPGIDGTTQGSGGSYQAFAAFTNGNVGNGYVGSYSEGAHVLQNYGSASSGTAIFNVTLNAQIRG